MTRNILLTVLTAVVMTMAIISSATTATATPGTTALGDKLRSNATTQEMVASYSQLVDEMLTKNGLAIAQIKAVASPADVMKAGQIALTIADSLLHDKAYGSRYSLAFEMGQIAFGAVAKANNAAVPPMEVRAYWNGCYGGGAMRAFGEATALPADKTQMTKVYSLIRTEYGDELAKIVVLGMNDALESGILNCHYNLQAI